jgi:Tfp pilus assembly protein PilN
VSQVNLLPPELRQRQAIRRTTSIVIAAGLAVLALVGAFYFLQAQRLSDVEGQLADQNDTNAQIQAEIAELQPFADLQAELQAKQQLVASLLVNEVSWSSALLDVSRVIPDASYLTSLTGQVAATAGVAAPPPEGGLIGSMTFQGVASQTETIATWLNDLEQVQGWVNAWVTNASESEPFSGIYSFASGLDLTTEATTARAQEGGR